MQESIRDVWDISIESNREVAFKTYFVEVNGFIRT